MSKFDHFNCIGPIYDLIFGKKKDQKMIECVDLRRNQRLLDVGGGTGRVTVLFKDTSDHLIIADSAVKMLHQARQKEIKTVNAFSERLPFWDRTFDRITIVDALHHVADQQETLDELWRLLAPGGRIVIEEPDIHHLFVKLLAVGERLLLMRSHFLSPEEIAERCAFDEDAVVETYRERGLVWIMITRQNHRD